MLPPPPMLCSAVLLCSAWLGEASLVPCSPTLCRAARPGGCAVCKCCAESSLVGEGYLSVTSEGYLSVTSEGHLSVTPLIGWFDSLYQT